MEGTQPTSLTKENLSVFFSVKKLELNKVKIFFSEEADVFIKLENNSLTIQFLNTKPLQIEVLGTKEKGELILTPGNELNYTLKQ